MAKRDFDSGINANMLKNVQERASLQANARTVIDLDISLIDEHPENRQLFSMNDSPSIAKSIESEGFFGAIEVYKLPNGRYMLSAGHQRVEALKLLGRNKVPAIVMPMPENYNDGLKKLIKSNVASRKMTPMDNARSIRRLKQIYTEEYLQAHEGEALPENYSKELNNRIAEEFGVSVQTIIYQDSLNELIPELIELIEQKRVVWSGLAAKFVGSMDEEVQRKIYREIEQFINVQPNSSEYALTRKLTEDCVTRVLESIEREKAREEFIKKYHEENISEETTGAKVSPKEKPAPVVTRQTHDIAKAKSRLPIKAVEEEKVEEADTASKEDELPSNVPSAKETSKPIAAPKVIDMPLSALSRNLKQIVSSEYMVQDKKLVSQMIEQIETVLSEIKGRI